MAQVELINVTKRFGTTQVVHEANMLIEEGEFIVLVGPSGCGKSTILRMIAGLESVSSGEIRIDGKPVNQVLPKDRNVAMVFQNYALYPHMSVFDNMAFSLKMAGEPKKSIGTKVRQSAEILELTSYLQRKPSELSGGQRQRVAMGRAIVRDPAVFLFDEPLSNLDAQLRTQMRMELKKLHQRMKTTTIYVTHDQIEAMTLADKIVILKDGSIQQVGSPIEVFERPINRFVAGFIGNPPTNILEAEFRVEGDRVEVRIGELSLPVVVAPECQDKQKVLVGIRPDSIKMGQGLVTFADDWKVMAEVIVSEVLGGQSLLEFSIGGNSLIAELEGRIVAGPGEILEIGFDLDRLLFFDPGTEEVMV